MLKKVDELYVFEVSGACHCWVIAHTSGEAVELAHDSAFPEVVKEYCPDKGDYCWYEVIRRCALNDLQNVKASVLEIDFDERCNYKLWLCHIRRLIKQGVVATGENILDYAYEWVVQMRSREHVDWQDIGFDADHFEGEKLWSRNGVVLRPSRRSY